MTRDRGSQAIENSGGVPQGLGLLDILSLAIYNEQSAHEFYAGVAGAIVNQQARTIFKGLADDEQRHRRLLEARYRELSQGQSFVFDATRVKKIDISLDSQTKGLDALDLALAAERSASQTYYSAAELEGGVEEKRMFESLAEEEDCHYDILTAEREALLGHPYWFSAAEQRTME